MQINKISNINFRENVPSKEIGTSNAILMLRDPQASVKFQHSQEIASNADTVNSNPIVSLGYKLYRTFNLIKDSNDTAQESSKAQFKAIA